MENSASAKYTKGVHHFKFNYSETKDLQPEQFISSLVFDALGNEWVIDCYPRGPCEDMLHITLFLVRPHREYKTVNPTISLRFVNRDGTKHTLPIEYLQGDITDLYRVALQQSLFQGLVFTFIYNSSLEKHFVKDGSFELICNLDNTEILHNRCSLGVPKSFDLHSQIGQLMESTETADVTFCIENRSFMCHRIVLTARSPVFKAELFGNMAEATQKRIKIEDMSPEEFEAMLHFIYTDSFPCCDSEKSSTKMAQHLFVSADRYAIEGLKALCEDKLCAHISFDMVTATLALHHNSPRLKNACLDLIAEPGILINWMLSDKYEDLVKSFPSIKAEIRDKVNAGPSFRNNKKKKEEENSLLNQCRFLLICIEVVCCVFL